MKKWSLIFHVIPPDSIQYTPAAIAYYAPEIVEAEILTEEEIKNANERVRKDTVTREGFKNFKSNTTIILLVSHCVIP